MAAVGGEPHRRYFESRTIAASASSLPARGALPGCLGRRLGVAWRSRMVQVAEPPAQATVDRVMGTAVGLAANRGRSPPTVPTRHGVHW